MSHCLRCESFVALDLVQQGMDHARFSIVQQQARTLRGVASRNGTTSGLVTSAEIQLRNLCTVNRLRNVFSWLAHTFAVESAAKVWHPKI